MIQISQKLYLVSSPPATLKVLCERLKSEGYEIELIEKIENKLDQNIILFTISNQTKLEDYYEFFIQHKRDFPNSELIGVYSGRLKIKISELYLNGFKYIYQIPFEEELLINKLFETRPVQVSDDNLNLGQLIRVNILEIEKQPKSPFDIYLYLPSNRKIVHYVKEGDTFDQRMLEKFKNNAHYNLYIKRHDLKKFNDFSQKLMSDIVHKSNLSEADKLKEVQKNLTNFMSPFFSEDELSEDEAQQTLINLHQLLKGLESPNKENKALIEQVQSFASQKMTHFSHSQNVATYCSLFGIALGYFQPETLKIGGLLHDLGLTDMPPELLDRSFHELNEEEQARYKLHPGNGKQEVLNKKMKIPNEAIEMILLHHERADGTGYPYGYKVEQIPLSARICAFADEFDKQTSVREGYRQHSPLEALQVLSKDSVYDEKIFKNLYEQFTQPVQQDKKKLSELQTTGKVLVKSKTKTSNPPAKESSQEVDFTKKIQTKPVKHSLSENQLNNPQIKELIEDLKNYFDELAK